MAFVGKLIYLLIVLVAGWFLTRNFVPWAIVRVGRLLGFPMKATPITKKRIQRFKRIRRGYFSFLGISILFVISFFLELIVNEKPLVVHYNGTTAFPAVSHWLDESIPFVSFSSNLRQRSGIRRCTKSFPR